MCPSVYNKCMTELEIQWLKDIYQYHITPARNQGCSALHCDHWSKLLYLHLKSKRNKEILSNDTHSVLSIDGMYVDIEFNAYIVDFNWSQRAIDSTVCFKAINPDFAIRRDEIFHYYSKPATEAHHLWHNKIF